MCRWTSVRGIASVARCREEEGLWNESMTRCAMRARAQRGLRCAAATYGDRYEEQQLTGTQVTVVMKRVVRSAVKLGRRGGQEGRNIVENRRL